MVALWDESVAIGVQIEVVCLAGSTVCFLRVVFSVIRCSFASGSWESSPDPFPTTPLSGELGLYRRGGCGFWPLKAVCLQMVVRLSVFFNNPNVLAGVTERCFITCSKLTDLASDAVRQVSSGSYGPSVIYGILERGDKFLGWPESVDQIRVGSCPGGSSRPVAEIASNRRLCDVSQLPSSGVFFSLNNSMMAATDAFLWSWDDLLAHAFTSFAMIREVRIKLMPSLTLICHLWLLGGHGRDGFRIFQAWH